MGLRISQNMPGVFGGGPTPEVQAPLAARAADVGPKQNLPAPLPAPPTPEEAALEPEKDFDPDTFEVQTLANDTGAPVEQVAEVKQQADRKPFSINELRSLIGQGGPGGFNLAPVAALVDAQTGSRMAPAFANMETPSRRRNQILKQIAGTIQAEQKLEQQSAKDALALLKSAQAKQETPGSLNRRRDSFEKQIVKQYGKFDEEIATNEGRLSEIRAALQSGSITRVRFVLANIVRNIGAEKGTLAEGDIRRALHPTFEDMLGSVAVFFGADGNLKEGVSLSPARLNDLKTIVSNATQKSTQLANQRVGAYTKRLKRTTAAQQFDTDIDAFAQDTIKSIGKKVKLANTPTGKPAKPTKDKFSSMTDAQLQEFIRSNRAK